MNEWTVKFETHSRDDVMKVCALLARGIGSETVSRTRKRVRIFGGWGVGKSAVSDGVIAALSDNHKSYKLPTRSLMEEYSCQAVMSEIRKDFSVSARKTMMSMYHDDLKISPSLTLGSLLKLIIPSYRRGLDFRICFDDPDDGDVKIDFNYDYKSYFSDWKRKWKIEIKDAALQTPQMAEILDHLRAFHERRSVRLANQNQPLIGMSNE